MFKNKKRLLSFILTLVIVLSMNVVAFADTIIVDTPPVDFKVIVNGATASYKEVTVEGGGTYPDVTTYTSYIEFPQYSTQNLAQVGVTIEYNSNFALEIDGIPQGVDNTVGGKNITEDVEIDFTQGHVVFSLFDSANPSKNRDILVNAGIKGKDVNIIFTFDMHNVQNWLNGNYNGAFGAPNPNSDLVLKARIQDVMDGFNELPATMPLMMESGDSAMAALVKASTENNFYIVGAANNYISEMGKTSATTIGEFDINSYSGWMYKMNGEMPNVGAGQYTLTTNDTTMEWGFTMDYGQDLGGAPW